MNCLLKGVNWTKKIECLDLENVAVPQTTVLENAGPKNALLENADIENVVCVLLEKLRFFYTQWEKNKRAQSYHRDLFKFILKNEFFSLILQQKSICTHKYISK